MRSVECVINKDGHWMIREFDLSLLFENLLKIKISVIKSKKLFRPKTPIYKFQK